MLRATATPAASYYTSIYRGRALLLKQYGINMHMPAITAELCIAPVIGDAVHQMLLQLHRVSVPSGLPKLRASAKPLPRLEPWLGFVGKAPHTLPHQMAIQWERQQQTIQIRGERGWEGPCNPFFLTHLPSLQGL